MPRASTNWLPDVFLTACAGLGIVKLEGNRYFTTELLRTLRKDTPGSLRGFALSQAAPGHWLPWGRFTDALKTGERQTLVTLKGRDLDYVPDESAAFTEAMTNLTSAISDAVACLVDTTRFTQAVDVGGAAGAFLYSLMRANAGLKGIVFDLPNVAPSASSAANEAGLAKRAKAVGGDFFESMPEGDLCLLKYILHDWEIRNAWRFCGIADAPRNPARACRSSSNSLSRNWISFSRLLWTLTCLLCSPGVNAPWRSIRDCSPTPVLVISRLQVPIPR